MKSILHQSAAIRAGQKSAANAVAHAIEAIQDWQNLNAVTSVYARRAQNQAAKIDAQIAKGQNPGPLAGIPFAAKNLFDVEGHITRAGSRATEKSPPAKRDAFAIRALESAGAILVASTNMDELAYGFTGENGWDGNTRNPRATSLSAGGSSSGSAALVGAGAVPFALGTDTNGSIRVPAALSGVSGLKPTYGRISRSGVYPFVHSLDHVGVLAANAADLATVFQVIDTVDPEDPIQMPVPTPRRTEARQRAARLGGYFAKCLHPDVAEAVDDAAKALDGHEIVEMTLAEKARAAAFVITNAESGQRHLKGLRKTPDRYGKLVRRRLQAGALLPAAWTGRAQKLRHLVVNELTRLQTGADILIAPATPCPAFPIGADNWKLGNKTVPIRLAIGMFTQPLTITGVPIGVGVRQGTRSRLPVGVQMIGRPFEENRVLKAMEQIEDAGFVMAPEHGKESNE